MNDTKWSIPEGMDEYLNETEYCDVNNGSIIEKARELTKGASTPKEAAMRIFNFVRDSILYGLAMYEKASDTLKNDVGQCFNKSNLQVSLLRVVGIPARFRKQLLKTEAAKGTVSRTYYSMITKLEHVICECYLDGRWIACDATPDKGLYTACLNKGFYTKDDVPTIDWDGENDLMPMKPFLLKEKGVLNSLDGFFSKELANFNKGVENIMKTMNVDREEALKNYTGVMIASNKHTDRLRKKHGNESA
ncbi:MAG: transglutaminase family protein [Candidatus Hodarchaeota archaeon]